MNNVESGNPSGLALPSREQFAIRNGLYLYVLFVLKEVTSKGIYIPLFLLSLIYNEMHNFRLYTTNFFSDNNI